MRDVGDNTFEVMTTRQFREKYGKSKTCVAKWCKEGYFLHAEKDSRGRWLITDVGPVPKERPGAPVGNTNRRPQHTADELQELLRLHGSVACMATALGVALQTAYRMLKRQGLSPKGERL